MPASAETPTMLSTTGERLVELRADRVELRPAADDRQLGARAAARRVPLRAGQREHRHRLGLALHVIGASCSQVKMLAGGAAHRFRNVDPARRRVRHETRREVDRVAEAGEGLPPLVAVGAAAQPAVRDSDLDAGDRGRRLELAQLERGGRRARGVVLVRERRAEHRVQVGALVAERQVEEIAAVRREDPLHAADEIVELRDRVVVVVVVDAAEPDEQRIRRPQLGEELAASGAQALVDRRQQPWPDDFLGQRVLVACGRGVVRQQPSCSR